MKKVDKMAGHDSIESAAAVNASVDAKGKIGSTNQDDSIHIDYDSALIREIVDLYKGGHVWAAFGLFVILIIKLFKTL